MCKGEEKTSDHSLLHCLKARILWQPIFALFGVEWVMHSLVGKKKGKGLEVAPLCFFGPFGGRGIGEP